MPRGKDISKKKIFQIVHLHENGKSARSIAQKLGINKETANRWIKRKSEVKNGNFNSKRKGAVGRKSIFTSDQKKKLILLNESTSQEILANDYETTPRISC